MHAKPVQPRELLRVEREELHLLAHRKELGVNLVLLLLQIDTERLVLRA